MNGSAWSAFWLILPFASLFVIFIAIPVFVSALLSLTYYNAIDTPRFIGLQNYIDMFTRDREFMMYVIPQTLKFAIIVGPGGYILSFIIAWMLAQLPRGIRTVLALIVYTPSLAGSVFIGVIWKSVFSGDQFGYLNAFLMNLGIINAPIAWLTSPQYLLTITIFVALWSSFGIGFLSILASLCNLDQELFEAAHIDGIKNRFQETIYVTIPQMKGAMFFSAIMSITGAMSSGTLAVDLSGSNPTPQNSAQTILPHMNDYAFIRNELGYASALSVVLLLFVLVFSKIASKLFAEKD
ncbi:MAG TPA: sugar ABC transporter permease [Candidatus Caccosoma faecigallinarum]|uniref:Sugar ABC transporter permease n=1 Tax=Candidatus Caccosoma faecigallinarum TaxID=2840720 RepID=A0A9D1KAK0_9FIRM|nr:sugar ABC transporter permease [Candidatus Caccosoma faecigallinarum]